MKIGRRVVYALLAALILFNLLLRYPRSDHELGVDSFFIHVLAGSILSEGHAGWVMNPLSYFGWYPLSYPSAGPFFIAAASAVTSTNLEASILLVSMLLGPIGTLGAFIMAREFKEDNLFALAVAMMYGLAPRFLSFTLWSASTRSMFMALLPIFIWALLRTYRKPNSTHSALVFVSLATLAATHRLVILAFVILLAFVCAGIAVVFMRILRIRFPKIVLRNSVRRAGPHIALIVVLASSLGMLFGTNVLQEYSEGEIASGNEIPIQLLNLSVSIARSGGLALALSLVGLVVITRARNKTIREPFLAMALVGLIPTFFLRQYTGFYVLPFLALFGGLGLIGILGLVKKRPRVATAVGIALVLAIGSFSTYVLDVEFRRSTVITSSTYETGVFVRYLRANGTMIANEGLMGIRVAAVSGVRFLPVGGAGTTFQSPELLAFGFYSPDEVTQRIVRVNIQDLTIETDSLWSASGIQAELDWVHIVQSVYGEIPARLRDRYEPSYYLELNSASGKFLAYGNVYCSDLSLSVYGAAYRIYDNGYESLWWLHSPGTDSRPAAEPERCP